MSKKSSASNPESFEAALAELQQLVVKMETGELPLEASVAAYRRGAELVQYCNTRLEAVEAQVKVFEAGLLKPFDAPGDAP